MEKKDVKKDVSDTNNLKTLTVHGTTYFTRYHKKYPPKKKWKRLNEKEVIAFIPGTIHEVLVKPGQTVESGDTLVVLEAMKMRNHVKSAIKGVIRKVHVSEGDRVPKNFLIIEFA